jgi:hypothetical protein
MVVQMHTAKKEKKKTKKKNVPLRYSSPNNNSTTTTKIAPETRLSTSDASNKETVHKRRRLPIKRF